MEMIKMVNKLDKKDIRIVEEKLFNTMFFKDFDLFVPEEEKEELVKLEDELTEVTVNEEQVEGEKELDKKSKEELIKLNRTKMFEYFDSIWIVIKEEDKELTKKEILDKYL